MCVCVCEVKRKKKGSGGKKKRGEEKEKLMNDYYEYSYECTYEVLLYNNQ